MHAQIRVDGHVAAPALIDARRKGRIRVARTHALHAKARRDGGQNLRVVMVRQLAVRVAAAVVKGRRVADGCRREVAAVDAEAIEGKANLRGVRSGGRVIRRRVEAEGAEGVAVQVRRPAPSPHVLIARVDLAVLLCQDAPVVVNGVDVLARNREADGAAHGQAVRDGVGVD